MSISKADKITIKDFFLYIWVIFPILLILYLSYTKIQLLTFDQTSFMYLFSTTAQVIASLYAITLTGYIFYRNNLKEEIIYDESLTDIIEILIRKYFVKIIFLGLICIISVLMCIFNIGLYKMLLEHPILEFNFIYQTMYLSTVEIVFIIFFTIDVANPFKIKKLSDKQLKKFERKVTIPKDDHDKSEIKYGDLVEFKNRYNELYDLIIDSYDKKNDDTADNFYTNRSTRKDINVALDFLLHKEILTSKQVNQFHEMRIYRNMVMHSSKEQVLQSKIDELENLYKLFEDKLNSIK